jgi:hypothetical protein
MAFSFQKHYTLEEARSLLPSIRQWLERMSMLRGELLELDPRIASRLEKGEDLGGPLANDYVKKLCGLRQILTEFQEREIQIKDLDRGLIDFPAIIHGKEVFLCWEQDEDDIEFWHDLDSGYAGRERL